MTRLLTSPVQPPLNSPRDYFLWGFDIKPNEPLIRQVLAYIDANRDRWDQDKYLDIGECGMVGCFAGWALMISTFGDRLDAALAEDPAHVMREVRYTTSRVNLVGTLGLLPEQFDAIYDFVTVDDPTLPALRHPTFEELCARIEHVTGIRYQPGEGATT